MQGGVAAVITSLYSSAGEVEGKEMTQSEALSLAGCHIAQKKIVESRAAAEKAEKQESAPTNRAAIPTAVQEKVLLEASQSLTTSVAEKVYASIMKVEADVRRDLYKNVVITGFAKHLINATALKEQLCQLASGSLHDPIAVHLAQEDDRGPDPWEGGSILANLSTACGIWMNRVEYDETGPDIYKRRFFEMC